MSNLTVLKNIFANLCRGGAVALSMLLLPPFLARILTKDAYGAWLLILQLSTYVGLLDLGIQTVIGRFVAHYNELGDHKKRDSIISSAIAILTGSGSIAFVAIALLAWQLPRLFPDMPAALQQDARLALMCVGGTLAVALPFSVFGAVFIGLQRYDIPAWIVGSTKIFAGVLVVLAAQASQSIVMMAVMVGITNLGAGLWQYLAYRKIAAGYRISPQLISKKSAIEVAESCLSLSVSTLGLLIVSGLDTTIIGFYDYKSIPYYALAATLTNFVFGISISILNTLIPVASSIGARNEPDSLGRLLVATTRYTVVLLIATNLPLILVSKTVIGLWVGADYAIATSHLFELLVAANFVRQVGSPYFTIAIGCGEHRKVILSPLIEAATNLIFSLLLTSRIGADGVAFGTLIGGFVSVGLHFFYNLPRTKKIFVADKMSLIVTVVKPVLLIVVPTIGLFALNNRYGYPTNIFWTISSATVLTGISWLVLWQYILEVEDREMAASAVNKVMNKFLKKKSLQ
ncbi:polysaccharide biosynthesis C-terminal domain-containing protein [Chamaesiphon sp. OTE_8_metabat_110]|uniref:polysaccharide biosynthesis C-terminal domain-containing protein n=1 Tax=Chamaesiphon sp. OTE_8_metabat_110 TaxID=2964696 RepID=UPI00286BD048|nr:polysaccharide biosynthesis C-terminal domain-containing protein [Chamaesiphon sp. OTE_8_metabat_110]